MEPPRDFAAATASSLPLIPSSSLRAPPPLEPISQQHLAEMAGRMRALVNENGALRKTIDVMNGEIIILRADVARLRQDNQRLKLTADVATVAALCATATAAAPYVIPVCRAAVRLVV